MAHQPYVPEKTDMKEFTVRALVLGLVMTVILGAANAYLGLRAGMTIAATYPAAVIGMAFLRLMKGSILEENIARTAGSIGESVAAGAIFTIPAFLISGAWLKFNTVDAYLKSAAMMFVGGFLGILFVTFLRKVMVTDPELKFPESVAAAEIHKAGQKGSAGAKHLFMAMGAGSLLYATGVLNFYAQSKEFFLKVGKIASSFVRLGTHETDPKIMAGGSVAVTGPGIYPAYIGVGYIIGPRLASLNFAGGVLAWGLFAPLLMFFLGSQVKEIFQPAILQALTEEAAQAGRALTQPEVSKAVTLATTDAIWKFIIRPIAVGGMLVGAGYTLFRMRKNLGVGIKRAFGDVKKAAGQTESEGRTEKDLSFKVVFAGLGLAFLGMIFLYNVFAQSYLVALLAAVVMILAGFFFAAVSGNLVGTIGSSNNPVSGLTLSTLIIAALLMVLVGATGTYGVGAVLGVATVVCVSSAVAGEMLQDLKVGHLLGGTPWKMQFGNIFGALVAALLLFFPLMILHGAFTFGSRELPAPQAGLMAALSKGIVEKEMAWPLVIVGMLMGFAMILVQVRSPMLVAVGMYLPLETTFAIFCGGMMKGIVDMVAARRNLNPAQKARAENVGILVAAGLIAGEALTGLLRATWKFLFFQDVLSFDTPTVFKQPSYLLGLVVLVLIGAYLVLYPLRYRGAADEPPPPSAVI